MSPILFTGVAPEFREIRVRSPRYRFTKLRTVRSTTSVEPADLGTVDELGLSSVLAGLADGTVRATDLLGMGRRSVEALVDQALRAAEHGRGAEGLQLLAALAQVVPDSPTLPLMAGHLAAAEWGPYAAMEWFDEALRRIRSDPSRSDPSHGGAELVGEIELARAEVWLSAGRFGAARDALSRALAHGSEPVAARARGLRAGLDGSDGPGGSDGEVGTEPDHGGSGPPDGTRRGP